MTGGSRIRQIGWLMALALCFGCFIALTFRVNTVKSEVRLAERRIVQLEREKLLLETEFQTRANQQQLADWNAIEFGYTAPRADQYMDNDRQLASLGLPQGIGAPSPIRVAQASDTPDSENFPAMVSPITGRHLKRDDTSQPKVENKDPAPSNLAAGEFSRAFGEASPFVARLAEAVE